MTILKRCLVTGMLFTSMLIMAAPSRSDVSAFFLPILPCPGGYLAGYEHRLGPYLVAYDSHPLLQWTKDGSQLLFDHRMNLYIVEADGSLLRRVAHGVPDHYFSNEYMGLYADISPDNFRIVYSTCRYPIEPTERPHYYANPLEPDSEELTWHNYEIEMSNIDGVGPQRLTNNKDFDQYPVWSPDGTRIAFLSDRDSAYGYVARGEQLSWATCRPRGGLYNGRGWFECAKHCSFAQQQGSSSSTVMVARWSTDSVRCE